MEDDRPASDRPVVTQAMEDYLKSIYKLQSDPAYDVVSTSLVAERMGVTAPSASNMVRKLADLRLVDHAPYRGVVLTRVGERIALETIRHHRLLERFLADVLGYSWDEVDAEADRLEHVISEAFEERIDEAMGFPKTDPHGAPIPDREGAMDGTVYTRLTEVLPGATARVQRVSDRNPEILRYLDTLGLRPGVTVRLREKAPFGGPLDVQIESGEVRSLGPEVAQQVHVVSAASRPSNIGADAPPGLGRHRR